MTLVRESFADYCRAPAPSRWKRRAMYDPRFAAITTDLTALEAVVRALARAQARRSRTALTELLESLSTESGRIRTSPAFTGIDRAGVCGVLDAWIEDLKAEALIAEGATT